MNVQKEGYASEIMYVRLSNKIDFLITLFNPNKLAVVINLAGVRSF